MPTPPRIARLSDIAPVPIVDGTIRLHPVHRTLGVARSPRATRRWRW